MAKLIGLEFVDAQQMHLEHPNTFWAPSIQELIAVKKHDTVKVSIGNERFWVELIVVSKKELTGIIISELFNTDEHGLIFGDTVEFERKHIYEIY